MDFFSRTSHPTRPRVERSARCQALSHPFTPRTLSRVATAKIYHSKRQTVVSSSPLLVSPPFFSLLPYAINTDRNLKHTLALREGRGSLVSAALASLLGLSTTRRPKTQRPFPGRASARLFSPTTEVLHLVFVERESHQSPHSLLEQQLSEAGTAKVSESKALIMCNVSDMPTASWCLVFFTNCSLFSAPLLRLWKPWGPWRGLQARR